MSEPTLPYWANWLISKIIKHDFLEEIIGDIRELYSIRKTQRSFWYCQFWLIAQLLLLFKRPLLKPVYNKQNIHFIMVKTHLKIGMRSLWKFKGYSLINLFGLTFGAAAAIILFLAAEFENSYDLFLPDHQQIYRVGETHPEIGDYFLTRTPMATAFKETYPEVIASSRFFYHGGWFVNEKQNLQMEVFLVDEDFPEIFQFEVLAGDFEKAVSQKGEIAITASQAKKFFGYESAVGQVITKYPEKEQYTVAAVIADPAVNSSLQFDGLISWSNKPGFLNADRAGNWYNTFMTAFVKLDKNADPDVLLSKTEPFTKENFLPEDELSDIILIPIANWHERESENAKLITLLMVIAITILIIAGFNFINLNTAQLLVRIKEVGIRKVLGSGKNQIVFQFIAESLIIVIGSLLLALALVFLSFPLVKELFGMQLKDVWIQNYTILPAIFTATIVFGIMTSLIPALVISRAPIIESVKGVLKKGSSKHLLQKGLIIAQFAASIFLLTGTFIIWEQINFMKNYDLNFDKNNTFLIYSYDGNFKGEEQLKNKLLNIKAKLNNHAQVAGAAYSRIVPGHYWEDYNAFVEASDPERIVRLRQATVDPEYFKTLDIEFVSGGDLRKLTYSRKASPAGYAVLNEAAMHAFGWETTEGKQLREDGGSNDVKILGVSKDFHYQGLNGPIQPMIHWISDSLVNNALLVRIHPDREQKADPSDVLKLIKDDWDQLATFEPFDYEFLDQSFNEQYEQQERLGYLAGFFSIIAFVIASLGLFSLSAFMIRRRKKEIGIRKILGASVRQLIIMLSRNFILLVLIALFISIPLVITSATEFLNDFAYKIEISWQVFAIVAVFSFAMAAFSISFQAIKTSLNNPVDEIKDE